MLSCLFSILFVNSDHVDVDIIVEIDTSTIVCQRSCWSCLESLIRVLVEFRHFCNICTQDITLPTFSISLCVQANSYWLNEVLVNNTKVRVDYKSIISLRAELNDSSILFSVKRFISLLAVVGSDKCLDRISYFVVNSKDTLINIDASNVKLSFSRTSLSADVLYNELEFFLLDLCIDRVDSILYRILSTDNLECISSSSCRRNKSVIFTYSICFSIDWTRNYWSDDVTAVTILPYELCVVDIYSIIEVVLLVTYISITFCAKRSNLQVSIFSSLNTIEIELRLEYHALESSVSDGINLSLDFVNLSSQSSNCRSISLTADRSSQFLLES